MLYCSRLRPLEIGRALGSNEPASAPSWNDHDDPRIDFTRRRTSATQLPDPAPLVHNLARGVLEVLAGVRDVDQLARWLAEEPYRRLVVRANLAARARNARGAPLARPVFEILSVRLTAPADGVVESVVVVAGPARTRAIAVRLEGADGRWRATSLALL